MPIEPDQVPKEAGPLRTYRVGMCSCLKPMLGIPQRLLWDREASRAWYGEGSFILGHRLETGAGTGVKSCVCLPGQPRMDGVGWVYCWVIRAENLNLSQGHDIQSLCWLFLASTAVWTMRSKWRIWAKFKWAKIAKQERLFFPVLTSEKTSVTLCLPFTNKCFLNYHFFKLLSRPVVHNLSSAATL